MTDRAANKPKHRRVFEFLQTAILSGRYGPGQRLPSETALVRRFEASRPTVAKALGDLQNAGLIVRRAGSGSFVRTADAVRNRLLGLLIPGLGNTEIFEPVCAEMARQAQMHQFILLWGNASVCDPASQSAVAEQLCRQYIDEGVAGVFFAPIELATGMEEVNHRIVAALDQAKIPAVLLDRDLEAFPKRSRYDLVGIDNRRAGCRITQHLLDMGCRHIEFVCRPFSAPTVQARIAGWREALSERGIRPGKTWLRQRDPADADFVKSILGRGQEAFVCANDITAANLMRSLLTLGVRIPEDVRVVGIDDVKYAQLLSVPLTTLRQPCQEIGVAAIDTMLQRIASPDMPARDILIDAQLVVRESCGTGRSLSSGPKS